jgi:hypothetical protein
VQWSTHSAAGGQSAQASPGGQQLSVSHDTVTPVADDGSRGQTMPLVDDDLHWGGWQRSVVSAPLASHAYPLGQSEADMQGCQAVVGGHTQAPNPVLLALHVASPVCVLKHVHVWRSPSSQTGGGFAGGGFTGGAASGTASHAPRVAPPRSSACPQIVPGNAAQSESPEHPGKHSSLPAVLSMHQLDAPQSALLAQFALQYSKHVPDEQSSSAVHGAPMSARQCVVAQTRAPDPLVAAQHPEAQSEFCWHDDAHSPPLPKSMQRLSPREKPQHEVLVAHLWPGATQLETRAVSGSPPSVATTAVWSLPLPPPQPRASATQPKGAANGIDERFISACSSLYVAAHRVGGAVGAQVDTPAPTMLMPASAM